MIGLGEIGQNDCFGAKMAIFWAKKGPKVGEKYFCQNFHFIIQVIDQKCSFFYMQY